MSDLTFDARVWKETRSLEAAGYRVKLIGCAYELARTERRRQEDVDVVEVPLGSRSGRVSLAGRGLTLLRLWLEILRTDADAYHAHNVHVAPAAWVASRLRRARLVYDGHELYGESPSKGVLAFISDLLGRRVERFVVRRSDIVITTNPARAEHLRRRHGREQISVLGNVPRRLDDVVPLDPGYPEGAPIVLYQGGIYARWRPFRETIQAIAELDVHFVILGFGRETDLALVRRWAEESSATARVHLLPPRPFDELVRTAAAASVGLVPVRTSDLGSFLGDTNKLFEYLMAGLPVVASDVPVIRSVVTEGDPPVGELFDPESPASIADAIRRVLSDPVTYEKRRKEARRLALERFNWDIEEQRLLGLYESILPRRALAGASG